MKAIIITSLSLALLGLLSWYGFHVGILLLDALAGW